MVHTTGGSEKTDGGKRPRARSGGGRGQGQSLWIDLCVPTFPPRDPARAAVLPPLLLPPPQSPGSHTLNSSHWALAWDAGSAGCIERRSPDIRPHLHSAHGTASVSVRIHTSHGTALEGDSDTHTVIHSALLSDYSLTPLCFTFCRRANVRETLGEISMCVYRSHATEN